MCLFLTDIAGQIFVTDQEGVFAAEDGGIGDDDAFRAGKRFHVEAWNRNKTGAKWLDL